MKKNITIKDIAKELGIHHTTVSRALRNCETVKAETRNIIWRKANEMAYTPNLLAQGFRNSRTNIIGVLVPDLQHYMFSKFISDFTNLAHDSGYSVMVFQSSDKYKIEKEIIDILVNYRLAGVVCSVSIETKTGKHFNVLKEKNIPLVFFDRIPEDIEASRVEMDNLQGAYDAVNMMIKMGRKRIALISVETSVNVYNDRFKGYKQALIDNNLVFNDKYCVAQPSHTMQDGYLGAQKLIELSERPDAILTISDDSGIGAMKYLKSKGILVPKDVSIVAFDNGPLCTACEPELTIVDQPIAKFTSECFDLLMNQIECKTTEPEKRTITGNIIFRASC